MLRRTRNEKILKTELRATKVHGVSQINPFRTKERHSLERTKKKAVQRKNSKLGYNLKIGYLTLQIFSSSSELL